MRFLDAYSHSRWLWHVFAAAVTALLVWSGFDWWFFGQTRMDFLYPLVMAAGVGGFFVQVLLPIGIFLVGKWKKNTSLVRLGVAVAQAEIVAVLIVAVYKAFTGRMQPEFLTNFGVTDISNGFQFGFLQHGIFWGWPSSHTAVAVAAMVVLYLSLRNPALRILACTYAFLISAGAAVGFHWFSDVLAGAIVGALIGYVVSKHHYSQ